MKYISALVMVFMLSVSDVLDAQTGKDKEVGAPAKVVLTAKLKDVGNSGFSSRELSVNETTFQVLLSDKAWLMGVHSIRDKKPDAKLREKRNQERTKLRNELRAGGYFAVEGQLVLKEHAAIRPSIDISNEQRLGEPEKKNLLFVITSITRIDDKNKALYPEPGKVRVQGKAVCGKQDLKLVEEPALALENGKLAIVLDGAKTRVEAKDKGALQATGTLSMDKKGFLRLQADEVKEIKE